MSKIIFPSPFADSGTKQAIPENPDVEITNRASFSKGFPDVTAAAKANGGKPPRLEDMNYILFALSNEIYEQQRGKIYTFESGVSYDEGAVIWYPAGGYFVKSLVDNNTTSDLSDTTKWQRMTVNGEDFLTKANVDFSNINNTNYAAARALNAAGIRTVVSTGSITSTAQVGSLPANSLTVNYRIWSDGWCQQWGLYPNGTLSPLNNIPQSSMVTLPFSYEDILVPWTRRSPWTFSPAGQLDFSTWKTRFDQVNWAKMQLINKLWVYTYDWSDRTYGAAPTWIVEGPALGRTVLDERVEEQTEGDAVEQLGSDVPVAAGERYALQVIAGSDSLRGGMMFCRHKFTQSGTLRAYMIRGRKLSNGGFAGNGMMITLDGTPILVAGGAGNTYNSGRDAVGGSGYNGGSWTGADTGRAGYSYDGTEGNSTATTGGAGAAKVVSDLGITAYGGSGYVHPDFTTDTQVYSPDDADYVAVSDSIGPKNFGRVMIIRGFEWLD